MTRARTSNRRNLIAAISCAFLVAGAAACADTAGPEEPTRRPDPAPAPAPNPNPTPDPNQTVTTVSMQNYAFADEALTIDRGTIVRWQNDGTVPHNTTSEDGFWGSVNLRPGESFERGFDQAGTFEYQCTLHSGMVGTVVVH